MVRFGSLVVLGAVVGCHPLPLAAPSRPATPQLPVVGRGAIEPDVSAVPADTGESPPARPTQYHKLTAAECRSLAIKNAPLAADLDSHPDNEPARPGHHRKAETADLARLVRGYAADEIRNRSAGDALELYYKLAAAEGQFDLAAEAQGILRTQLAAAEKAIKVGAADRADAERLRRQVLEVGSQLAKLEAGTAVLNAGLAGRLGLDPADPLPIWPDDPLKVTGEAADVEQAVATGMRYRPDLNLLRVLTADEDHGGELANAVLSAANPLLGSLTPPHPLAVVVAAVKKDPTRAEAVTRRQLLGLLASREPQADAEIRAAAATVRGNRLAVAAKAAEVRNLREKVSELEKREKAGQQVTAELTTARLDLLKLRGELVQAAADWAAADAKLRQATGLLVRE